MHIRSYMPGATSLPLTVTVERPTKGEHELMDYIESYLSAMVWPKQEKHVQTKQGKWTSTQGKRRHINGRLNVGGAAREAFVLGKARKWDDHVRLHESVHNKKHPDLLKALRQLVRLHNPGFRYNAIQLNKNVQTAPHYDRRNQGTSYCVAVGRFTGGGLRLFTGDNEEAHADINNDRKWVRYDGAKTLHATVPVRSGVRFAVVYYYYKLQRPTSHRSMRASRRSRVNL